MLGLGTSLPKRIQATLTPLTNLAAQGPTLPVEPSNIGTILEPPLPVAPPMPDMVEPPAPDMVEPPTPDIVEPPAPDVAEPPLPVDAASLESPPVPLSVPAEPPVSTRSS